MLHPVVGPFLQQVHLQFLVGIHQLEGYLDIRGIFRLAFHPYNLVGEWIA